MNQEQYSNLFEAIVAEKSDVPAIVLVDASGSVRSEFVEVSAEQKKITIFDKMAEYVSTIENDRFRLVFWNSENPAFPTGVFKLPNVVTKEVIKQPFILIKDKIAGACLTYPHLGVSAIEKSWIDGKKPTDVYFLTDGQIGYNNCPYGELINLKSKFLNAIKELFQKYNNVHLHVIAFSNTNQNFDDFESVKISAGGDIWDILQTSGLTKSVTQFKAYAPNYPAGYRHLYNIIPPAGFVPYMTKCFSETKTAEFISFLHDEIQRDPSEENLIKMIQALSSTIRVLTKDKPQNVVTSILNTFSQLFKNTSIHEMIVQSMLIDTIKSENSGSALVLSQFRAKLKDLFKQAQGLLTSNVSGAISMTDEFMTVPLFDKIVTGNKGLMTEASYLNGSNYPKSSVKIDKFIIPVFPVLPALNLSTLSEQCTRQYVRAVLGSLFANQGVNSMGDEIIYIMMGLTLRVVCSDLPEQYKTAYRTLSTIMLRKKRLNSDITELSRLEQGELPVPNNGRMEDFYRFMVTTGMILGLDASVTPMSLWYALCLALGNQSMIVKQLIHCDVSIANDFHSGPENILSLIKAKLQPITHSKLSDEMFHDYTCVITLKDCSETGGYKIARHISPTGYDCYPNFVASEEGYQQWLASGVTLCPACYKQLDVQSFFPIGPKVVQANIFADGLESPFGYKKAPVYQPQPAYAAAQANVSNKKGHLVILKGTVGSGKTTYASKIQQLAEAKGWTVFNEGTDKYCRVDGNIKGAVAKVTNELRKIDSCDNPKILVIVDTCGENTKVGNVFGYDFSQWTVHTLTPNYNKEKQNEYLAWSLKNVLSRPLHDANTPYWLNHVSASVKTCVDVHCKKAKTLFGAKGFVKSSTLDGVLAEITPLANSYQEYLNKKKPIDAEIQNFVDSALV